MARRAAPPAQWAELRPQLAAAGYTAAALSERLGITYPDDIGLLNWAPAVERLATDTSAAATLMRLLFLERDEPVEVVEAALPRQLHTTLTALGLLQCRAARVRARLRLDAVGSQYFLADRRFRAPDGRAIGLPAGDPIYPPSSDSIMLRDAVSVAGATRALDLCAGSGIQGLQVADRAGRVTAVDISARAAALVRINAAVNGVANVDARVGDVYGPVRREAFDLIIANPPFVASPYAGAPAYHSGGPTGDAVLRRVLRGLAAHLAPGGRAFAISHLALRSAETVEMVAEGWFRGFPGRALVLILESGTAVDLAAAQALFALDRGLKAYAAEVQRWVQALTRTRVGEIVLLLVVAERSEPRGIEIADVRRRVLPIPLSPSPGQRLDTWLAAAASPDA